MEVNLVSAFGRGETLALALQEAGFKVRILDFTDVFPDKFCEGTGPFPVVLRPSAPFQKSWFDELKKLPRGLVFWLPEGPLELSGPMREFFEKQSLAVEGALSGDVDSEFTHDWMRRFLYHWTSAYHFESWTMPKCQPFPAQAEIGLIPSSKEARVQDFERFRALGYEYVACKSLNDISLQSGALVEVEVDAGQVRVFRSDQWIWCLSSQESELIGATAAEKLFTGGIRKAEWMWLNMYGACERGPWSNAFPEQAIIFEDVCLPWAYANGFIMRWIEPDVFEVWMKVPASSVFSREQRATWAGEVQRILRERLPQAQWAVNPEEWGICPHSSVLEAATREWRSPSLKNFDLIAPETLGRVDFTARFEREAQSYDRLTQWRNELLKKQGAKRDRALHPS